MKWYVNLKIANKLIIAFLGVALITGLVGIVGIFNIYKLAQEDTALFEDYTVPIEKMGNIQEIYERSRIEIRDAILDKDPARQAANLSKAAGKITEMKTETAQMGTMMTTAEGQKLQNTLAGTINEYEGYSKRLIAMIQGGQYDQASQLMATEGMHYADVFDKTLNDMDQLKFDSAKQKSQINKQSADRAILVMALFILFGVGVAGVLGVLIARSISRPIRKLVDGAGLMADGDLNAAVAIENQDEIGELARAFNNMADHINQALLSIHKAANEVDAGAQQISASGEILAQGSTEQASSIEEITATIEQVATHTKQNAANANHANELAISCREQAKQGNQQMQGMLEAMQEINEASISISKIIKVIDEIAFQTNILALNAAVEAARAGQHGKGFAVVAEEVRNLAARSANAAKETTTMIEGSIQKVDRGTQIANDTAKALEEIVEAVAKTATLVDDIAGASNEQATAITQVNQAIAQVSQVVQTNSSTAEESASASEELASQADILKSNVDKFKLKQSNGAFRQMSGLSPDVMQAIEAVVGKKQLAALEDSPNRSSGSSPAKRKIILDDTEFGKY